SCFPLDRRVALFGVRERSRREVDDPPFAIDHLRQHSSSGEVRCIRRHDEWHIQIGQKRRWATAQLLLQCLELFLALLSPQQLLVVAVLEQRSSQLGKIRNQVTEKVGQSEETLEQTRCCWHRKIGQNFRLLVVR